MTWQELKEMTGSEEQASYAMGILLKNCKAPFVRIVIQAELKGIDEEIEAFKKEGIICETNHTNKVNWAAACKAFGDEPGAFWSANEEQKQEAEKIEERCREAEALLYRRNRTVSLLAVR